MNLTQYLNALIYPGRGVILGNDGERSLAAYFIMGRSKSSQSRVIEETPDGVRTRLFSSGGDDSLLVYHPVRLYNNLLIVTNGDQTDTIRDYLSSGQSFEDALNTREYEPDAPHYTPRVSGIIDTLTGAYKLSILRKTGGVCERAYFCYDKPGAHIIHTYGKEEDGVLKPFLGEPIPLELPFGADKGIWDSLNNEYRVALYVSEWRNGERVQTRIINRMEVCNEA